MGSWQCYAQRQEEGKWDERIDPALADQALFEVRTALEHGPKNVRAHEHHVQCLYGLRKIGPAIAAVKALLAVDPHSKYGKRMDARFKGVDSLCALGDDEVDNMDDDEALGAFEAAAELAAVEAALASAQWDVPIGLGSIQHEHEDLLVGLSCVHQ